jgi:hypothetical protein
MCIMCASGSYKYKANETTSVCTQCPVGKLRKNSIILLA